ncbi:MAG: hypothetical protein IT292_11595 [Deltaproteobacteria bacterium]|nr:hypothetical protein [Deltaproteobacteria bacterium]
MERVAQACDGWRPWRTPHWHSQRWRPRFGCAEVMGRVPQTSANIMVADGAGAHMLF